MLKPLCPYGPVQDLSVIEETNAYCWVDIVVNAADAWVRFEGDGASNLADPSFAAKAGETNHVVLLIGKTCKVTCDMPFTVVGKSDPSIDEWWEFGWNEDSTSGETPPYDTFAESTIDIVELRFDGRCRIWKLGNEVIRYPSGSVYLNGEFQ